MSDFKRLIERIKSAEGVAADELVKELEPEIRRFVRFRMKTRQLQRFIESVDISQSVFAKFFVDLQDDAVDPDSIEQVRMLLMTMAKNKLIDHIRRSQTAKRDDGRLHTNGEDVLQHRRDESAKSPSELLEARELLDRIRDAMSDEDLVLVDKRLSGCSWQQLADEYGTTKEAMRKRVKRIIEATAKRLASEHD